MEALEELIQIVDHLKRLEMVAQIIPNLLYFDRTGSIIAAPLAFQFLDALEIIFFDRRYQE